MKPLESENDIKENTHQKAARSPNLWQRLLLILLPITLTIGGVLILVNLLNREKKSPSNTTVQQAPLSVAIAEVQTGQIKENSEYIATLQSLRSTSLQANIQGKVSRIFVKKGSQVAAQTPLLEITPTNRPVVNNPVSPQTLQTNQLQLQIARTQLQELESQRLSKLQNVRLNQENYDKYSNLASQGAVSKQTKEEYARRLAAAKIDFNNLDTKIQAQQETISKLTSSLQQTAINNANKNQQLNVPQKIQQYKIKAPFKGTVANISIKVGDVVNSSTRVVTVTQNQPLEVDIPVSIENKSLLRKGMPVEIINSKGENIGTAKVFFISPEANPNTRTILVKALFENSQGKMETGHFAKARINWNQHSGLLIPTKAVFRIAGETFVYVAEKQKATAENTQLVAKQKQVKLGKTVDNRYQVITGLQPGEKVVVSNLLNIKNGQAVIVK